MLLVGSTTVLSSGSCASAVSGSYYSTELCTQTGLSCTGGPVAVNGATVCKFNKIKFYKVLAFNYFIITFKITTATEHRFLHLPKMFPIVRKLKIFAGRDVVSESIWRWRCGRTTRLQRNICRNCPQ